MAFRYSFYPIAVCASVFFAGALLGAPRAAHAQAFDFENQAATFVSDGVASRPGAFTSLALNTGGLTLTITRPNATRFDIVDNTAGFQVGKPASFGARSLDPFFSTGNNGFIGNFSSAVTNISVDFGDYTPDDTDTLTLTAFSGADGTGTLLGTTTVGLPDSAANGFSFSTVVVAASGIQSFTLSGTSDNPGDNNSVFIDNIRVNAAAAAPEPGSLVLLLGAGIPACVGGVTVRRRRGKK